MNKMYRSSLIILYDLVFQSVLSFSQSWNLIPGSWYVLQRNVLNWLSSQYTIINTLDLLRR